MDDESNSNEPCTSTGEESSSLLQATEDSEPSLMEADSGSSSNVQIHPKDKAVLELIDKYHTRRATQWALFCWNTWRSEKMEDNSNQSAIPFFYEICGKSIEVMDTTLAKFVTECKNKEGENYTPETLRGVIFGLQRFLKTYCMSLNTKPVTFIKNEFQYPKYCQAMKKRIKDLAATGVAKKNAQAVGITSKEEEYLWDLGIFGCNTAESLSNTVFFYIVKIFGIVSSTALRTMKPDTFIFGENEFGKYLELDTDFASELDIYNQTSCCHNLSLLAQNTTTKLRHYCNENNPRTFYNILKYYVELIKLVDSGENCLFLRPKRDMVFCNLAIGRNQLQRKFGQIMKQAGLKGYFTTQALVQSSLDNLQVKGYMVRRKQAFIIQHQLEISKILDPPPGIIRTYDVKTQTKAILQLVNASQGLPIQPVLDQSQLQYMYQVNQIPQIGSLIKVQQSPSKTNTDKQTDRMDLQTALQASQNILKAGLQPSTSAAFVTGVSNLTNQLTAVNHILPKTVKVARLVPTATETANNMTTDVKMKTNDSAVPVPVFLRKAGSDGNDGSLNNAECDSDGTNDYDYDNVIIKQEPADYEGECFQTPDSPSTCQSESSRKRKPDAAGLEDASPRKTVKNKGMNLRSKEHKTNADSNKEVINNKTETQKCRRENETEIKEEMVDTVLCEAEIEYSFSNDLSKKITKQEVSLKEDGQTMFSFSGTSKMGKSVGDLDINLGDYLPENCTIKPGDIDIKRMILSDGGKMMIKLKYNMDK
ncbi:uncharacterized protein LOC123545176 [Mercenaria mercenaria]|uniref:uncharacterized protein LOC123545176 n=1 Tax=Mercenaria mercenaria TaxID=6596 RepID=UPI00234F5E7B|nr:uncharacterized protein LOC123545176 [Mercenaria mercenaria]